MQFIPGAGIVTLTLTGLHSSQVTSLQSSSLPAQTFSPASFSLESPLSSYQASPSPSCLGFSFDHRSPPTTAEIREFLQAEKDLSNLTLSEREQRELFLAAQIIQKAYRSYKGRKKSSELERQEEGKEDKVDGQAKEAKAAVVIQNYYRRYKQVNRCPPLPAL